MALHGWSLVSLHILCDIPCHVHCTLFKMMSRAVAYLNTDMCVSGPDLEATSSPALRSVLEEAAKSIPYPGEDETGLRSYYDYWRGGLAPG